MFQNTFLTLTLAAAALSSLAQAQDCPTVGTVENFNLQAYAQSTWYVHQQAENAYSPLDQNNCVRAQYTIRQEPTALWGYTVDVQNSARSDTGEDIDAFLCAYQPDAIAEASKLMVAPCYLPKELAGPYWVVAYDETQGYALISGGQPTIPNGDLGCRTGDGINESGLWIFTRTPVRNEALIQQVRQIAASAGFDVTVLNDVDQTGCYAEDTTCVDSPTAFDGGWLAFGATYDCDWVAEYVWYRCWLYGDNCPLTCGKCD